MLPLRSGCGNARRDHRASARLLSTLKDASRRSRCRRHLTRPNPRTGWRRRWPSRSCWDWSSARRYPGSKAMVTSEPDGGNVSHHDDGLPALADRSRLIRCGIAASDDHPPEHLRSAPSAIAREDRRGSTVGHHASSARDRRQRCCWCCVPHRYQSHHQANRQNRRRSASRHDWSVLASVATGGGGGGRELNSGFICCAEGIGDAALTLRTMNALLVPRRQLLRLNRRCPRSARRAPACGRGWAEQIAPSRGRRHDRDFSLAARLGRRGRDGSGTGIGPGHGPGLGAGTGGHVAGGEIPLAAHCSWLLESQADLTQRRR